MCGLTCGSRCTSRIGFKPLLVPVVMDEVTKEIQSEVSWCLIFADEIVLVGRNLDEVKIGRMSGNQLLK